MKCLLKTLVPAALMLAALPAIAQTASHTAQQHAGTVAKSCVNNWETPACLSALSESNMVMLSNYGGALQEKGHNQEAEQVKQHCAASTAAREKAYPADAMRSAFTECANTISDVAGATGMQPDAGQYQLLVSGVMCLGKTPECDAVNKGLSQYR